MRKAYAVRYRENGRKRWGVSIPRPNGLREAMGERNEEGMTRRAAHAWAREINERLMREGERYCEMCESDYPDIGVKWYESLRIWLCDSCVAAAVDMAAMMEE
jgi:hypothetical protein